MEESGKNENGTEKSQNCNNFQQNVTDQLKTSIMT
jgi:hypothetical protein